MPERDKAHTPWGWLRGFAWFLLAWPLLSLLALDQLDLSEWGAILAATLGPAAVGAVLLGVDWALTRWLGTAVHRRGQPVPGTLRDLSNLGLTLAILLGLDIVIVGVFDGENLLSGAEIDGAMKAIWMFAGCLIGALVLRGLHRLRHGPPRTVDLGEGWDHAPSLLRLLGYLVLIPSLLVCTVMIDYALHDKPGFGLAGWIALPALLVLGLRSAMARAPRHWARTPWEAWLRRTSLELPWWFIACALVVATGGVFLLIPTGFLDDGMSTAGRVIAGLLLVPIGLLTLGFLVLSLAQGIPRLIRNWRVARRLSRHPEELVGCRLRGQGEGIQALLRLRDGRELVFSFDGEGDPALAWLRCRELDIRGSLEVEVGE